MIDIQAQDCWKIATTFQSQIQNKATGTILWHHHGNIQVPELLSHFQILPIGVYWIKEMFSDSSNIFLWHESVDTKKKAYFWNFSWFQVYIYKLCMIMCASLLDRLLYWNNYCVRQFIWKVLSFPNEMISA